MAADLSSSKMAKKTDNDFLLIHAPLLRITSSASDDGQTLENGGGGELELEDNLSFCTPKSPSGSNRNMTFGGGGGATTPLSFHTALSYDFIIDHHQRFSSGSNDGEKDDGEGQSEGKETLEQQRKNQSLFEQRCHLQPKHQFDDINERNKAVATTAAVVIKDEKKPEQNSLPRQQQKKPTAINNKFLAGITGRFFPPPAPSDTKSSDTGAKLIAASAYSNSTPAFQDIFGSSEDPSFSQINPPPAPNSLSGKTPADLSSSIARGEKTTTQFVEAAALVSTGAGKKPQINQQAAAVVIRHHQQRPSLLPNGAGFFPSMGRLNNTGRQQNFPVPAGVLPPHQLREAPSMDRLFQQQQKDSTSTISTMAAVPKSRGFPVATAFETAPLYCSSTTGAASTGVPPAFLQHQQVQQATAVSGGVGYIAGITRTGSALSIADSLTTSGGDSNPTNSQQQKNSSKKTGSSVAGDRAGGTNKGSTAQQQQSSPALPLEDDPNNTHRGELSIHEKYRYDLSKAQLKASSRTSALLAGFAMIALVELQYQDTTPKPLLITLGVVTTLLVSVHLLALMMSTCLLPYIEANGCTQDSPHIRLKFYIQLSWLFSTCIGLILFLVEIGVIFFVKFDGINYRVAAYITTAMLVPVVIVFTIISYLIHRSRLTHTIERVENKVDGLQKFLLDAEMGAAGHNGPNPHNLPGTTPGIVKNVKEL